MNKTHEGILRSYNAPRAFGFLEFKNLDHSVETFFFHITDIVQGSPVIGQRARFNVDYHVRTGQLPHAIQIEIELRPNIIIAEAAKDALSRALPSVESPAVRS